MATCRLDISTSPNLKRNIKHLGKKYPHIKSDLSKLTSLIESDYTFNAHADRLKMPGYPHLQGKVWKYDCKSSDIKKHQRESMRLVCMFLDDATTLYGVWCFVRDNASYVEPKEMDKLMKDLRAAITNPSLDEDEEADSVSA